MNTLLKHQIEAAPDIKTRQIIKETAALVSVVVDMIPAGKVNWLWIVTNWKTVVEIIKLVIEFVKKVKTIIHDNRSN